jgi:MFS family permease
MGPVSTRQRLRVLTGFAVFGVFWGGCGATLPLVRQHAGVDNGQLGTALLLVGIGALASMRVTGALLDRFGRVVILVSGVAFAVAGFLPVLAHGLPALGVTTLLLGMASGALDVCINALAVEYESRAGRRVLNTAHGLFSIGAVVSAAGVAVARSTGAPLWALLLSTQAVVLAATFTVRPSREPWPEHVAHSGRVRLHVPPVLAVLGALAAIAYLVENAWQSWSAILLQSSQGAGPGLSSTAPAVFAASAAAARLRGDALARLASARVLLGVGASVAAAGSVLAAQTAAPWVGLVGIAIAGVGTAVCAPTLLGAAGHADVPLGRAAAMSTVTTLAYLGFLVGPPLVGLVSDTTSLPSALTLVGTLAAVLAVAALSTRVLRVPAQH